MVVAMNCVYGTVGLNNWVLGFNHFNFGQIIGLSLDSNTIIKWYYGYNNN